MTPDVFPTLCHFRDEIVGPIVTEFIRKTFNVEPTDMRIDTFGKSFEKGEGLASHLHGNSMVTTVYYPEDTKAGLLATDPRFNAERGYPRPIRDNYFGDYYVAPKAGEIWIMPSYIQHSVETSTDDMRLSLVNDFTFKA